MSDIEIVDDEVLESKLPPLGSLTPSPVPEKPAIKPSSKIISSVLTPLAKQTLSQKGEPITIQPTTPEEIEKKMVKQPTKSKKPIKVETVLTQRKSSKLQELLVKDENETNEFFLMRSQYSKIASQIFHKYPVGTFILLGRMGANRGYYGLKYPEETNKVLDYVDEVIKSLP